MWLVLESRQLLRLARRGADPFNFKFVEHHKVSTRPSDRSSCMFYTSTLITNSRLSMFLRALNRLIFFCEVRSMPKHMTLLMCTILLQRFCGLQTPVFTFMSHGDEQSVWSVDGELVPAYQLSGQVFRGLVNLFARGPEV